MTGRMGDEQLDREIRTFLAGQAEELAGAPTATEMALRIGSRAGARTLGRRPAPQALWLLVAGLLILALAVVAAVGTLSRRVVDTPLPTSYEAVFVRQAVVDGSTDLVVVAVDARGHQREVARLPAGVGGVRVPTMGAVSPSGLLVVPRVGSGALVHYEIIDLKHPDAQPIVVAGIEQDSEQIQGTPYYGTGRQSGFFRRPGIFWGPGDQLAIPWYERNIQPWHLAFIDGRTGAGPSVDLPDDGPLLPHWTADGSGVLLGDDVSDALPASAVLRPDGTLGDGAVGIAPSTYSRRYRADGAVVGWFPGQVSQSIPGGTGPDALLKIGDVEVVDVAWTTGGDGVWLVVRSGENGRDLTLQRRVPVSDAATVTTIVDTATEPAGSRPQGEIIGVAPDDAMIVLSLDRVTGTAENGGTEPVGAARLIAPGSGDSFEIDGTFAGWMKVDP